MATYQLPKLPYGLGDLAPVISEETMDFHYNKHLKTYVDNLNGLIPGTKFENMDLVEIVKNSDGGIFNNAGQVLNHNLFFLQMSPKPQAKPTGELAAAIDRDFGSFEKFQEAFEKVSTGQFGSGWGWLATDKSGKLSVLGTANGDNPVTKGLTPVLGIDVWEHSYYLDYRNKRADYIKSLWKVYDWKVLEQRYSER